MFKDRKNEIYDIFYETAEKLLDSPRLYSANPLSDEELEEVILGRADIL